MFQSMDAVVKTEGTVLISCVHFAILFVNFL